MTPRHAEAAGRGRRGARHLTLRVSAFAVFAPVLSASALSGCSVDDTVAYLGVACETAADCADGVACADGVCGSPPSCGALATPDSAALCAAAPRAPYALCSCDGYVSDHALVIEGGGSFGTNGAANLGGPVSVDGDVVVAGTDGIVASGLGTLAAGGSVRVGGQLRGTDVTTGKDAEVAGNVAATNLRVGGALRTPEASLLEVSGATSIGSREAANVVVSPPCDCSGSLAPAIAALVRAHRADNDDAAAALDPFVLDGFSAPQRLTLACGRYHLSRLAGSSALTIAVTGDTWLFVDGDVALDDTLTVTLATGAHLRLFVDGDVRVTGALTLGDPARPERVDVFVAGGGTFSVAGRTRIVGAVIAPLEELVNAMPLETYRGALQFRRVAPNADVTVHYDAALRERSAACW